MSAQSATEVETGTDELLCRIDRGVAIITLNRPQSKNALSDRLTPALRRMIALCGTQTEIRSVLITGAGDAFCAGGDVKGMGGPTALQLSISERIERLIERQRTLTGALVGLRKPTIAALPGPAAGAGLAIALACDIRIAAENAFVSTAYARIGLSGDYGITWLLIRTVGPAKARELLLLSDRIDAREGLKIGLFNRIVSPEGLVAEAFDLALRLADGPSAAFAMMKDNLDEAQHSDFLRSLDAEAARLVACTQTDDHREAVRAFVEKRRPNFR